LKARLWSVDLENTDGDGKKLKSALFYRRYFENLYLIFRFSVVAVYFSW
jgi:hypothetical protein